MTSKRCRVGGIDYLNALPLTAYLEEDGVPPLVLSNHAPSELARRLRARELDVALAPVVEYLASPEYRIVPAVCISSYGAVESIRLYHRRPLDEVRAVGLDTSSRTSALLVRLLFRELWGGSPRYLPIHPEVLHRSLRSEDSSETDPDAILLIGDAALRTPSPPTWKVVDVGTEWTRWTGLPFEYAAWLWRGDEIPSGLVERLLEAKARGIARVDDIVRSFPLVASGVLEASACREYLRRTIQYDLAEPQAAGLQRFFSLLERNGLVATPPRPVSFVRAAS